MNKLLKVALIGGVSCIAAQFVFYLGKACGVSAVKYLSPEVYNHVMSNLKNVADRYEDCTPIDELQAKFIYFAAKALERKN